MNYGAFIYKENLFNSVELDEMKELATKANKLRSPIADPGSFAGLEWHKYSLDKDTPNVKKILNAIGTDNAELIDFYYLDPGAKLHPHKDLTGAGLNNRIRFHVPIITNPKVLFEINGEKDIFMKAGDLWCLDTSYTHAVHNGGKETRIHIVVECYINDEIRKKLPNDFKSKIHTFNYFLFLIYSLIKALFINTIKNPKYLITQFRMITRFIKWRILKIKKPD